MRYVRFKFRCNILISGKIIKEMPGSIASGTPCIISNFEFQIHAKNTRMTREDIVLLGLFKSICTVLLCEHAVAQLVEALRYKSEGRGLDSRWCYCNFSLT